MCGRYNLRATPADLMEVFELFREPNWPQPRYNIAPTQTVLAIRFDEDATPREPVLLKWGLIPSWAKDTKIGNSLINARADLKDFHQVGRRRSQVVAATHSRSPSVWFPRR
jgi:putative SOS response-associated peptidase YedK